jgi:hypothetical protein
MDFAVVPVGQTPRVELDLEHASKVPQSTNISIDSSTDYVGGV